MPKVEPKAEDRADNAHRVRAPTVSRAPVRLSMDARRLRAVVSDDHPLERSLWLQRLTQLLTREMQAAMAAGVVTDAEADQLLARLVLVIDQAVESFP
jgi:hypothetical protein